MEWNTGNRPGQPATSQQPTTASTHKPARTRREKIQDSGLLKGLFLALLFSGVVLAVAAIFFTATGSNKKSESGYVNSKKFQAVFLNGGQVYFGHIKSLNGEYIRMSDIYYLRVNQTVQPNQSNSQTQNSNDISLVKLGCELHGPDDQMVINREQVIFWENLKDDGQVAQAVEKYIKDNPNGQQCSQANSQSSNQQSNTPAAQTQTNTQGTSTTPSTNTGTKKP